MKKFLTSNKFILKIFLMLCFILNFSKVYTQAIPVAPEINAKGVVLMDAITGNIIYSKNPYTQFEPASTTKVMTAILTLENCDLDEIVTIGDNPPNTIGSALGIVKGETYTVKELLYALILLSGNDCANALAEHISGSVEEFAKLMTEKAKEVGANNTVFKNPSGLPDDGHITTPYDLSLIMKAALAYPEFLEISRTMQYFYEDKPYPDGNEKWAFNGNHPINKNSMYYYEHALSGKTGYTIEANHTYTAAAKKGDQVLIASFLNAENKDTHFRDVGQLFDYGFDNFETIKIIEKNEVLDNYKINDNITIPLLAENAVYYTKNKNIEMPNFSIDFTSKNISKQAIQKGEKLFNSTVIMNNDEIANLSLISGITREYTSWIAFNEFIHSMFEKYNLIIFILILTLILFIIITIRIRNKRNRLLKKKRKFLNRSLNNKKIR